MSNQLIDRLFIGAGAMKSGTTWLYSVLDMHPDIFFSLEKELHYFYAVHVRPDVLSGRARLENASRKYLGIEPERSRPSAVRDRLRWVANYLDGPVDDHWYRSLFALRHNQKWAADFSNLYAHLPHAAWARMANQTGELRVLYTLRNPVERLWSHVKFHLKLTGQEVALDTWRPDRIEAFYRQPFIWENSEYGAAIRRMRDGLPDGVLRIVFHEDIHADPSMALSRIERFLEIASHDYPASALARRINATQQRPVPAWFRDRLSHDTQRIIDELRAEGLAPPASWTTFTPCHAPAEP